MKSLKCIQFSLICLVKWEPWILSTFAAKVFPSIRMRLFSPSTGSGWIFSDLIMLKSFDFFQNTNDHIFLNSFETSDKNVRKNGRFFFKSCGYVFQYFHFQNILKWIFNNLTLLIAKKYIIVIMLVFLIS